MPAWTIPWPHVVTTVGDPYLDDVLILLHMDGAGTSFTDSSVYARTVSVIGNTTQSAAQSKWGNAGYYDGAGDSLSVPDAADLHFSNSNFTCDGFVRPTNIAGGSTTIFGQWGLINNRGVLFRISETSASLFFTTDGATNQSVSFTISPSIASNAWVFYSLVRSGNDLTLYIEGVQQDTAKTLPTNIYNSTNAFEIGGYNSGAGASTAKYLDEFRLTAAARYAGNFTPPTTPFPDP